MKDWSHDVPDRILFYGVTGSGECTGAERLGDRTGLPVTSAWCAGRPGWRSPRAAVQREA